LYNDKTFKIKNPEVYLIGSSFGGPAVILASGEPKVKKVVAFSPVINWQVETKKERLNWLGKFTKDAFGEGYRFDQNDWEKLKGGKFYNPMAEVENLDKNKIMIFHAADDEVVYLKPSEEFSKKLGCKFVALKSGGHLSSSNAIKPEFWKKIKQFFK
jgi:predicted alpha/beta hydrolase family esterase